MTTHRRLERLFYCLISAMVVLALPLRAADPQKTTIADVLYRADGTAARGTLLISWPAFSSADGKPVAAGTLSVKIGPSGAVSVALVPTQGATPAGLAYKVVISLDDGTTSTEYWAVPTLSPTTIAAIRSTQVPTSVAMQVVSREYLDGQLATTVRRSGDETDDGVKQFWQSPLVPAPDAEAASANKTYVDAAVSAAVPNPNNPLTLDKGGTGNNTWSSGRCVRVSNDGSKLESAASDCGLGGNADWSNPGAIGATTPNSAAFTSVTFKSQDAERHVVGYSGADLAARITAAIADCPAEGCRLHVDVPGALASDVFSSVTKPIHLTFAAGTWTLPASTISLGPNIKLEFQQGAKLSVPSGAVLNIRGSIDAPAAAQIFTGTGAVKITGNPEVFLGWFGGSGDGRQANSCSINAGSNVISCTGGQTFSPSDVGKILIPWNYGSYSYSPDITVATITAYNSPTSVTIDQNSSRTVNAAMVVNWGTDNLAAFRAAVAAKPCGTLRILPALSENVAYGGGPTVTAGITYPSLGGDYLFSDHVELGWPLTSACNGFRLEGSAYGSYYGASPTLQFPMNTGGGIWVRSEAYSIELANLSLIGSAPWHQSFLASYTIPGNTNVYDPRWYYYNGITVQGGGKPKLNNVSVHAFAGNGVIVDGGCNLVPPNGVNTGACQPDFWQFSGLRATNNRGCGLVVHGGDANAGSLHQYDIQFNGTCGIQESSSLSTNTYADGGMHGNSNNNGLAGGTTQTLSSCSIAANVMTCTASSTLANNIPQLAMWVTTAGQADATFNGTCRISTLPSSTQFTCPFSHANGATTGGTVRTATGTETMLARDTGFESVAATPYKAGSWRVTSGQPTLLLNPYHEANQPCPQGMAGALQLQGSDIWGEGICPSVQWPSIGAMNGVILLNTASSAGVEMRSHINASALKWVFRPGIPDSQGGTTEGSADILFRDRNNNDKAGWHAQIGAYYGWLDYANGGYRQVFYANGDTRTQSGGGNTTKLNWDSGSGTDFGNGSGVKVGGISTAGLGTFNGGLNLNNAGISASGPIAGATTAAFSGPVTSTVATGTAPLVIASTTSVANLNADLLDGQHASSFASDSGIVHNTGNEIVAGTKTFSSTISGSVTGNAGTATALAANGSNCPAGQFPKGVDADGSAEDCAALTGSDLPAPSPTTLGGVQARTCSGTDKLSAIGTDGVPVCSADSGGGSGGTFLDWQKALSPVTGDGSEHTVYQTSIPSIPAGKCLQAEFWYNISTAGGGSKSITGYYGTATITLSSTSSTSTAQGYLSFLVCNDPGVQNAQTIVSLPRYASGSINAPAAPVTAAVNASTTQTLKVTQTMASGGGEIMTPRGWLVKTIQ